MTAENTAEIAAEPFDPKTQILQKIPVTDEREDGTIETIIVENIVSRSAEEIAAEEKIQNEILISERIKDLKLKVAIGTATAEEKSDLQLLIG